MDNNEFEQLKEALRKPATPESMKQAAEAFRQYTVTSLSPKSRPTLVSLSAGKDYPTAIPLEDIPRQLETNPKFYEKMRQVLTGGK